MPLLRREQVESYQENGFLIVHQLIPPEWVRKLQRALMEIVDGQNEAVRNRMPIDLKDGTKVTKFQRFWDTNPVFQEFLSHSKVGQAAAELMQTAQVRLHYDLLVYKEPRVGGSVPCHQDYSYWRYVSTSNLITAWMAISRVFPENGGMYMVPGSHKWGLVDCLSLNILKNPGPEYLLTDCLDEAHQKLVTRVPLVLEPGDVSFHHALVMHCSTPNTSDVHRMGYVFHLLSGESRYVEAQDLTKSHEIDVRDGEVINSEHFPLLWP
jgi:phytanoyl-CoA hydroxylase